MNELFVPYKESLEIRELGFDEPCLAKYATYNPKDPIALFPQSQDFFNGYFSHCRNSDYIDKVAAPTFSQAFKFFREKYKYHMSVFRTHDNNWGADLWLLGLHKPKATIFSETYEKAELECLRKLIEICKYTN